MAWTVQEKDGQFRFWSTNLDQFITKWSTRLQMIEFIDHKHQQDAKLKTIEAYMTFPEGWQPKNGKPTNPFVAKQKYLDWVCDITEKDNAEELIDARYDQIQAEIKGLVLKAGLPRCKLCYSPAELGWNMCKEHIATTTKKP